MKSSAGFTSGTCIRERRAGNFEHVRRRSSRISGSLKMEAKKVNSAVSLAPYFKVHEGKMDEFKKIIEKFYALSKSESKLLHYTFCKSDDDIFLCRESYEDYEGLKTHLDNVLETFLNALKVADLVRVEVHAPESEMPKIRTIEALAGIDCAYYTLDGQGFSN